MPAAHSRKDARTWTGATSLARVLAREARARDPRRLVDAGPAWLYRRDRRARLSRELPQPFPRRFVGRADCAGPGRVSLRARSRRPRYLRPRLVQIPVPGRRALAFVEMRPTQLGQPVTLVEVLMPFTGLYPPGIRPGAVCRPSGRALAERVPLVEIDPCDGACRCSTAGRPEWILPTPPVVSRSEVSPGPGDCSPPDRAVIATIVTGNRSSSSAKNRGASPTVLPGVLDDSALGEATGRSR